MLLLGFLFNTKESRKRFNDLHQTIPNTMVNLRVLSHSVSSGFTFVSLLVTQIFLKERSSSEEGREKKITRTGKNESHKFFG